MRLLELLRSFSRKERALLVSHICGFEGSSFVLGDSFRRDLGLVLEVDVPASAFVTMDYHLDWLWLSLHLSKYGIPDAPFSFPEDTVQFNIEDIDLLVAFEGETGVEVVLVEAKGDTAWSERQLSSKASRLRSIFGYDGRAFEGVYPSFVLMSPLRPEGLETLHWPDWMAPSGVPYWLPLPLNQELLKPTRCDREGNPTRRGTRLRVDTLREAPVFVPREERA